MKKRLDILLTELKLAPSREMARRFIQAGEVRVNGQISDKPGMKIDVASNITVDAAPRFVSRGGEKLAGAFEQFNLNVADAICADVGASTGGFTDCLLQEGAAKIYAIDVGYGQIAQKLRDDERVIVMERTNARYVETLDDPIDFICVDASFISLKILLPVIKNWLQPTAQLVVLIKPQFEAGRKDVGKGGVVKDRAVHRRVLADILGAAIEMGYSVRGVALSPITGPKGNVEFLGWLGLNDNAALDDLADAIEAALPVED